MPIRYSKESRYNHSLQKKPSNLTFAFLTEAARFGYYLSESALHGLYKQLLVAFIQVAYHLQEFMAHFRELTIDFENDYDVSSAGISQDASSWPALIERAQRMNVELKMSSKR